MQKTHLIALLLTMTGVFVASNIYTFIPIYEKVSQSILITEKQAVVAGSLFTLFYSIGLLCFGAVSSLFGQWRILVWGMFCSALATIYVGISNDLLSLYLSRSLQGFALASFAPMAFAYCFDLYSKEKRTLLLVFINTGYLVAGIFGQLCSAFISQSYSWRTVYFFFSAFYFIFFVFSFILLPKTSSIPNRKHTPFVFITKLLKIKGLLKYYLITFTLLFSSVAFYDILERTFENAQYLRTIGLVGAGLSLFTGKLIERWKTSGTLIIGLLLGVISMSFMLLKIQKLMPLLTTLFISAIALLIPTVVSKIGTITGEHRVKALSIYSFILLLGASLAPLIVVHFTFQHVLLILLSLFVFNLFLIVDIKKVLH